ncbi:hypothetical protein BT69DRAFT_1085699 [Atractiella rhizophila]|nr:hypothetical protein BT69DRAFT_1085699 [Atractiella rhizophila]
MLGPFRASLVARGGLLWKTPALMSATRKARQRKRLKEQDNLICAAAATGVQCEALSKALLLPTEAQMLPKDKYTCFDKRGRNYRRGIHKLAKFSKVLQRVNPPGY